MAKTTGKVNVNFTNDNLNTSLVFEGGLGPKGGLNKLAGLITDGMGMVRRDGFRELVACSSEKEARETMDWILSNVWPRDIIITFNTMIDSSGRRVFVSFRGPDALQNARFSKRLFLQIQKNATFVAEQIRRMQYQCRYLAALVPFYLDRLDSIVNEAGEYQRFIDSEINRLVHSRNPVQDDLNEPSIADATERAMNPVNTWVKQTGFQAPSPLTPTKGSKGLLGNCSTAGQVVTGLVVGGAIFALYKTCKK